MVVLHFTVGGNLYDVPSCHLFALGGFTLQGNNSIGIELTVEDALRQFDAVEGIAAFYLFLIGIDGHGDGVAQLVVATQLFVKLISTFGKPITSII